MIARILAVLLLSGLTAEGAFFRDFPGFERLFKEADFVGIVQLGERDVPTDPESKRSDWVGPHRFFEVESRVVFKGAAISGDVARLADRRIGRSGASMRDLNQQEILAPEGLFLVFLIGDHGPSSGRYQWDEIHAEGAVLPVSPLSNLVLLEHGEGDPLSKINTVVREYTEFCRQLYEHAVIQEKVLTGGSEQGGADQPATDPEGKAVDQDEPETEAEARPQ